MKPFALLVSRPPSPLADDEYASYLSMGGLETWDLKSFNLTQEPLPDLDFDHYSGLIITGSPYGFTSANKDATQRRFEAELKDVALRAIEQDFPMLGVCFGLEVIVDALGGKIEKAYGEEISPVEITLTDEGVDDPMLANTPRSFHSITGHNEACTKLPEAATVLATGENCPVQLIRVKKNTYATQFHPEISMEGLRFRLDIYDGHYFPPGARERIEQQAQGANVNSAHDIIKAFVTRYAR
ncbi:MAG: gamma-glutamyl-gamma-aminobutyrate hydrolase family protein [Actinomycetaceae bacterium]|nr:gamma-glutamyl-gamma-aminobutyrate hydrolase family protein [Actinomycetaceae bacterium]